jgi:hypothetical protein
MGRVVVKDVEGGGERGRFALGPDGGPSLS